MTNQSKIVFYAFRISLESCIFDPNFVPPAPKLRPGKLFKDFKPDFQIHVNRKSEFLAALHVTLMSLKFETLTFKIDGLWATKHVFNPGLEIGHF